MHCIEQNKSFDKREKKGGRGGGGAGEVKNNGPGINEKADEPAANHIHSGVSTKGNK